jgi:large conductance mechanosensitive channel
MKGFLGEFRDFAMRGNAVDLAVGFIIGAAFTAIVTSLVNDIIMPPIGLLLGNVDFTNLFIVLKAGKTAGPYLTLADARTAGATTINYGVFINALISFVIVALVLFILIRYMNKLKSATSKPAAAAAPTTRECPYCCSNIPIKATRCPNCTSNLTV